MASGSLQTEHGTDIVPLPQGSERANGPQFASSRSQLGRHGANGTNTKGAPINLKCSK